MWIACVLLLCGWSFDAWAGEVSAPVRKTVLVLHSYHPTMPWTKVENEGIASVLDQRESEIRLYVEYMDSRRFYDDPTYMTKLLDLYSFKYCDSTMDAVICTDDKSYQFFLGHGRTLFGDVPMVFCGVNYFDPGQLVGHPKTTGIVESMDTGGTLDVLFRLKPDTQRVIFLGDRTSFGAEQVAMAKELVRSGRWLPVEQFEFWDDFAFDELKAKVQHLPSGTVLFLLTIVKDRNGMMFQGPEHLPELAACASVPIFGNDMDLLGKGLVGGILKDGFNHGVKAARMVKEILHGKPVADLPVCLKEDFEPGFDYELLTRFGISTSLLPPNAKIVNQPHSFYAENKEVVWAVLLVFAVLSGLVILLASAVAKQRKVERALRISEERQKLALEGADLGTWDWDLRTNAVTFNERWAAMLGYALNEIQPTVKTWEDLVHPDDMPAVRHVLQAHLDGKTPGYEAEHRLRHKSGAWVWVLDKGRVIEREAQKRPLRACGTHLDITARKHVEAEQRRLEENLRQTEKMQAIGQLAGGVAHDFNNQLAAIQGYAELLEDRLEDAQLRGYAHNVVTSATRAAGLTRQLLAFSRKGKFQAIPVDVHRILAEVVTMLERSIDKRICIHQILNATEHQTQGDPNQLQNAILNLALNARDAMPLGGHLVFESATVDLDESSAHALASDLKAGRYVQLSVRDTGCGMTDEVKTHLFEPFFTTKKPGEGTGMGLASVYGTIRNHHGTTVVLSEVGKGSTFVVYLPVLLSDEVETEGRTRRSSVHGRARILVVEDEESVRCVLSEALQNLGYDVHACRNGREAVDFYEKAWTQVDLVLLDMVMPEMGGRDTFAAMRRTNERVRVLLLSGYSLDGEAQTILDEGALGFVEKPFVSSELAAKVAEALGGARDAAIH